MATIVVDLDGTIINSTKRHYLLLKKLLRDNSIFVNFDHQEYLSYKRNGHNNYSFLTKKLNLDPELANKIQKEWINNIESPELISTDSLYPDAIKFLNDIKNLGHNIIFLTSRQSQENLHKELKHLGLMIFPKQIIVVCGSKVDALRNISDKPKIMIGDTEMDFEAAEESNAKSYILDRGFRSSHFLHKIGVKETYNSLGDITLQIRDIFH